MTHPVEETKKVALQIVTIKKPKGGFKINCPSHGVQEFISIPNPTPKEIGGGACKKCLEEEGRIHTEETMEERMIAKLGAIKIDHTDTDDEGYNRLCSAEINILLDIFKQELSLQHQADCREFEKEIEKELLGWDDGKRTNKEKQLLYKFKKLVQRLALEKMKEGK